MREGIALLQKVFQLRTCENTVFANRSRPCMLHQIQRCTAPCVGLIAEADYREDVQSALLFLQGKTDEVLAQLKRQMDAAAAALQFERAARTRDKIARLQQLQSRQFVESATAGDIDVDRRRAREQPVRGERRDDPRRPARRRPHVLPAARRHASSDAEVVTAFLAQHYVERPGAADADRAAGDGRRGARRGADGAVGAQGRDRRPIPAASGACG